MTDSRGFPGASDGGTGEILSCQSLLKAMGAPLLSRSSSVGLASAFATPSAVRLGPIPRNTTLLCPTWLPRMNPAITTLSPVSINARVLGLTRIGTVAAGKEASFVVLDANPLEAIANARRISAVYLRGQEVDRNALKARFNAPGRTQ